METIFQIPVASQLEWTIFYDTILAYIILNIGIHITNAKGQNFFTWLLWSILDFVLYIMIKEEKGLATMLVFACVIGSFGTSIHLFRYKKKWTRDEWRTLSFVITLLILMIFSDEDRTIIIFAVISEMVAGWPLLKETWKDPDDSGYTLLSYMVFLLGYILTIYKSFIKYPIEEALGNVFVENILFPLSFIVFSFFDTFPLLKKWICKTK